MTRTNCDEAIVKANALVAENAVGPAYYGPVWVRINAVHGDGTIDFATGGGHDPVHTIVWGDHKLMWTPCPSTLGTPAGAAADTNDPSQPYKPEAPKAHDEGYLYLSAQVMKDQQLFASDPKWPWSLPGQLKANTLQVELLGLVVTGVDVETGLAGQFDLFDPTVAGPQQTITYRSFEADKRAIDLQIHHSTVNGLQLAPIKFWPTSIAVTAFEVLTGESTAEDARTFDLMREHGAGLRDAGPDQDFTFDANTRQVTLDLSRDTMAKMGITYVPARLDAAADILKVSRDNPRLVRWARRVLAAGALHLAANESEMTDKHRELLLRLLAQEGMPIPRRES